MKEADNDDGYMSGYRDDVMNREWDKDGVWWKDKTNRGGDSTFDSDGSMIEDNDVMDMKEDGYICV
jgi:hypothetical protein